MNPWPFIVAAYVLALGAVGALTLFSLVRMRAAERQAESLKSDRNDAGSERGS